MIASKRTARLILTHYGTSRHRASTYYHDADFPTNKPEQPLATTTATMTTPALATNGDDDGPSSSVFTSTCHHIWSDKDVTTTPALASPNDDGGCGHPQSKLSPIITMKQFVSHITLPLRAIVFICFSRLTDDAILLWSFRDPHICCQQSLVECVRLQSECLFINLSCFR